MEKIKVIVEWTSDGGINVMMQDDLFAGMGETVQEAINDLKQGVAFFIETAKEKGFPYKDYLDTDYEIELDYDAVSMLKYARKYIKDTKLDVMPMTRRNRGPHSVKKSSMLYINLLRHFMPLLYSYCLTARLCK